MQKSNRENQRRKDSRGVRKLKFQFRTEQYSTVGKVLALPTWVQPPVPDMVSWALARLSWSTVPGISPEYNQV